jgi:DedD protein
MRDTHRMKEKLELSIDNRQVVGVVGGSLVVLGAVFVLGVVVGQRLGTQGPEAGAPDLLAALDRKAAQAMERIEPALTFHDELAGKPTVPAATRESPPVLVEPVTAMPEPNSPPALALPAVKEEPVLARAAPVAGESALKDAFARAEQVLPPSGAAPGAFSLQLAASQSRSEAERYVLGLRNRGYAPFIQEADVPGRGMWYRVRMGSFPSREAATAYLVDFKRETNLDAFVTHN